MLNSYNSVPSSSVRRGDIFYADLSPVVGSEQGGLRPVLIIQNDVGNKYSPTVIAAAITSRMGKTKLPTHIDIYADRVGLAKDSVILLEQIRTLDKRRLREKMGHLDDNVMEQVNNAIAVSFGLHEGIRESVQEDFQDNEIQVVRPSAIFAERIHSPRPKTQLPAASTALPDGEPAAAPAVAIDVAAPPNTAVAITTTASAAAVAADAAAGSSDTKNVTG